MHVLNLPIPRSVACFNCGEETTQISLLKLSLDDEHALIFAWGQCFECRTTHGRPADRAIEQSVETTIFETWGKRIALRSTGRRVDCLVIGGTRS